MFLLSLHIIITCLSHTTFMRPLKTQWFSIPKLPYTKWIGAYQRFALFFSFLSKPTSTFLANDNEKDH